jgi:hypothetical protein
MLFGMGMTLTPDEDEQLADIIRPCYASLALANDYFSFDREWQDAQEEGGSKPLNAVYLYMKWRGASIPEAKQLVREATNRYERQFLDLCDRFRQDHPSAHKLDKYLGGLSYQVSGNVVWSLNCPRYHPECRYDPNAGVEDMITAQQRGSLFHADGGQEDGMAADPDHRQSIISISSQATDAESMWSGQHSRSSSISEVSVTEEPKEEPAVKLPTEERLGMEVSHCPSFPPSRDLY